MLTISSTREVELKESLQDREITREDRDWVCARQIESLYSNSLSANIAVITAVIVFNLLLIDSAQSAYFQIWAVFMLFASCWRLFQWRQYKRYPEQHSPMQWGRLYTRATFLVGLGWSALGLFIWMSDDFLTQGVSFLVMMGAVAASATVLSSLLPAFFAYILPMTISCILAFALNGTTEGLWASLGLAVYVLMIIRTAINSNRNLLKFLGLQRVNQTLIEQLNSEISERKTAQVELKKYSAELEQEVERRTGELTRINRSLESEIQERRRAEENLQHLAHHDVLTSLPNRLLLDARLGQVIERARRHDRQLAVLFMDLDGFKNVNDSLGHHAGDELLCMVAERLQNTVRKEDTVARLGGDEFVVIMADVGSRDDIDLLAKKLMAQIEKSFQVRQQTVFIGTSIGISLFPENGDSTEELLTHADAAMYRAKEMGRRNFQYYAPDMTEAAYDRVMLESALRKGLEEQQFVLYYQPQIDLHDGRIVGVEALIRWRHPDLGILAPGHFIQAAEDSGLIVPMGKWVLEEACRQMVQWKDAGLSLDYMAVNLAGQQIHESSLYELIQTLIIKTGCKPEWLELEITETFIMQRIGHAIETLDQLKQLGVNMAIDDFGTGYSSLSYLRRLPIDKLKIDRSFIRDITIDPNDAAIVQAIIGLGQTLNLEVIAEGVETLQQKEFLLEQGCDQGQGYYIGHPEPAEKIGKILMNWEPEPVSNDRKRQ